MYNGRANGLRGHAPLDAQTVVAPIDHEEHINYTEHHHRGSGREGWAQQSVDSESSRVICDPAVCYGAVGVVYLSK